MLSVKQLAGELSVSTDKIRSLVERGAISWR